jgi:hypothetical protein
VVKNVGTSNAQNVTIEFDLPQTNTSPNVYLLGEVGAIHRRCAVNGTSVVCPLGRVKPGKKKTRWIDVSFPVTTQTVVVFATVNSTNVATVTAWDKSYLGTWDTPISAPAAAHNKHCSGQGLTAFWECIVTPASTQNHDIQFETNGSISFVSGT